MNLAILTGKIYQIENYEDCVKFRIRVCEPSGSYSIKCRGYGNLIRYIESELNEYDDVLIVGKTCATSFRANDSSFIYTSYIKARFITKLTQTEYGAYYDDK